MATRPFTDTLRDLRGGVLMDELSEGLNKVVSAVRDTGKVGSLTLTIKVKPASKGNLDTMFLEDTLKIVAPENDKGATVFFATPEGNLQRNDPRQTSLELKVVPEDKPQQLKDNINA